MNCIASNHDEHKKRCPVIIETLKNYLMHDELCPDDKEMFD